MPDIEFHGALPDATIMRARRRLDSAPYAGALSFIDAKTSSRNIEAKPEWFIRVVGSKAMLTGRTTADSEVSVIDDIEGRLNGLGHTGIGILYMSEWRPA